MLALWDRHSAGHSNPLRCRRPRSGLLLKGSRKDLGGGAERTGHVLVGARRGAGASLRPLPGRVPSGW